MPALTCTILWYKHWVCVGAWDMNINCKLGAFQQLLASVHCFCLCKECLTSWLWNSFFSTQWSRVCEMARLKLTLIFSLYSSLYHSVPASNSLSFSRSLSLCFSFSMSVNWWWSKKAIRKWACTPSLWTLPTHTNLLLEEEISMLGETDMVSMNHTWHRSLALLKSEYKWSVHSLLLGFTTGER